MDKNLTLNEAIRQLKDEYWNKQNVFYQLGRDSSKEVCPDYAAALETVAWAYVNGAGKESVVLRTCPECNNKVASKQTCCGMTYGRRGWRQLGVYDS